MKVGCDIVEIERVRKALQRTKGFPNFLTERETAIFNHLSEHRQTGMACRPVCGKRSCDQGNARHKRTDPSGCRDTCGCTGSSVLFSAGRSGQHCA